MSALSRNLVTGAGFWGNSVTRSRYSRPSRQISFLAGPSYQIWRATYSPTANLAQGERPLFVLRQIWWRVFALRQISRQGPTGAPSIPVFPSLIFTSDETGQTETTSLTRSRLDHLSDVARACTLSQVRASEFDLSSSPLRQVGMPHEAGRR